jgi:hypothetical protein
MTPIFHNSCNPFAQQALATISNTYVDNIAQNRRKSNEMNEA